MTIYRTGAKATTPAEKKALEGIMAAVDGLEMHVGATILLNVLCAGLMESTDFSRADALKLLGAVWDGMEAYQALRTQKEGSA